MTLLLNGSSAVSVRLWQPWTGAWVANVDLDPTVSGVVPSGPVVLTIGTSILRGAVDPDASGTFGAKGSLRVIGGSGGWHRSVGARHFHNDAGVLSTAVIAATAAEVGEIATDALPSRLGVDFERTAGPASRVLSGRDWYVDPTTGTTIVGPRPTLPFDPTSVDVLSWDPKYQVLVLASDKPIAPGTVIIDTRLGTAPVTVRDVEQSFDEKGSRATCWCGSSAKSKLATIFSNLVSERGRLDALKTYRYRIVLQGPDGRLTLQAVDRSSGAPDSIAIKVFYGIPGASSLISPGIECAVTFLNGDPTLPVVVGFEGADPLASGVATSQSMTILLAQLIAFLAASQAFYNFPAIAALSGGTAQAAAAAAATLAATAALPTNFSLRTKVP